MFLSSPARPTPRRPGGHRTPPASSSISDDPALWETWQSTADVLSRLYPASSSGFTLPSAPSLDEVTQLFQANCPFLPQHHYPQGTVPVPVGPVVEDSHRRLDFRRHTRWCYAHAKECASHVVSAAPEQTAVAKGRSLKESSAASADPRFNSSRAPQSIGRLVAAASKALLETNGNRDNQLDDAAGVPLDVQRTLLSSVVKGLTPLVSTRNRRSSLSGGHAEATLLRRRSSLTRLNNVGESGAVVGQDEALRRVLWVDLDVEEKGGEDDDDNSTVGSGNASVVDDGDDVDSAVLPKAKAVPGSNEDGANEALAWQLNALDQVSWSFQTERKDTSGTGVDAVRLHHCLARALGIRPSLRVSSLFDLHSFTGRGLPLRVAQETLATCSLEFEVLTEALCSEVQVAVATQEQVQQQARQEVLDAIADSRLRGRRGSIAAAVADAPVVAAGVGSSVVAAAGDPSTSSNTENGHLQHLLKVLRQACETDPTFTTGLPLGHLSVLQALSPACVDGLRDLARCMMVPPPPVVPKDTTTYTYTRRKTYVAQTSNPQAARDSGPTSFATRSWQALYQLWRRLHHADKIATAAAEKKQHANAAASFQERRHSHRRVSSLASKQLPSVSGSPSSARRPSRNRLAGARKRSEATESPVPPVSAHGARQEGTADDDDLLGAFLLPPSVFREELLGFIRTLAAPDDDTVRGGVDSTRGSSNKSGSVAASSGYAQDQLRADAVAKQRSLTPELSGGGGAAVGGVQVAQTISKEAEDAGTGSPAGARSSTGPSTYTVNRGRGVHEWDEVVQQGLVKRLAANFRTQRVNSKALRDIRDGKKATNLMLSPLNRQPSEKEKAGRIPMRRASNRNVEVAPLATATLSPPHFATAAGGGEDEPVVDYWAFIATLAAVLHCEQRELPNRVERATQLKTMTRIFANAAIAAACKDYATIHNPKKSTRMSMMGGPMVGGGVGMGGTTDAAALEITKIAVTRLTTTLQNMCQNFTACLHNAGKALRELHTANLGFVAQTELTDLCNSQPWIDLVVHDVL